MALEPDTRAHRYEPADEPTPRVDPYDIPWALRGVFVGFSWGLSVVRGVFYTLRAVRRLPCKEGTSILEENQLLPTRLAS
jgi:hypothetical protein